METIFLDNKCTKPVALKGELRMIQLGDLTIDAYFRKIESITTLLTNLRSPMINDDVVTYALNGLSDKYDHVAGVIHSNNKLVLQMYLNFLARVESQENRIRGIGNHILTYFKYASTTRQLYLIT